MISRPLTTDEKHYLIEHMGTVFGICLESPKFIPEYVRLLQKTIVGLNVRRDGEYMVSLNRPSEVQQLPKNLKNLEEACTWLSHNHLPYSTSFATIAANDKMICVAASHLIADGTCYKETLNFIQHPEIIPEMPSLPIPFNKEFKKEIDETDINYPYFDFSSQTVIYPKKHQHNHLLKKPDVKNPVLVTTFRNSMEKLVCFDPISKTAKNLTRHLWLALTLSMNAFNGKLSKIGLACPVNLRPKSLENFYLNLKSNPKSNINLNQQYNPLLYPNLFSNCWFSTPCNANLTCSEIAQNLYNDFRYRCKRGDLFAYRNPKIIREKSDKCSRSEVSNLGVLSFQKPIIDAWAQITVHDKNAALISLLSFTLNDKNLKKNTICGKIRISPSQMLPEELKMLENAIKHYLFHINPKTTTLKDAYNELCSFFK